MYDILIVGGGPAALSAGIYGSRGGRKTAIIEKMFAGGQAGLAYEVANYPGFELISGVDLSMAMSEHAQKYGCEIIYNEVTALDLNGDVKTIAAGDVEYKAKTVILAMGARSKKLGVEGELKLKGHGVSYCSTCDGAFYKGKTVAVVGGGNTAVEDAIYLTNFCEKVYLIHRRDSLRAEELLQKHLFANDKVEVLWNKTVVKLIGEGSLNRILIKDAKDESTQEIEASGLFIAVGTDPQTEIVKGVVDLTKDGYIKTDTCMRTNLEGVFAAGDVRDTVLRQILTAASDGAIAATAAGRYISGMK